VWTGLVVQLDSAVCPAGRIGCVARPTPGWVALPSRFGSAVFLGVRRGCDCAVNAGPFPVRKKHGRPEAVQPWHPRVEVGRHESRSVDAQLPVIVLAALPCRVSSRSFPSDLCRGTATFGWNALSVHDESVGSGNAAPSPITPSVNPQLTEAWQTVESRLNRNELSGVPTARIRR